MSGVELVIARSVAGAIVTGGKLAARVSGIGELCHDTWAGLDTDLPTGAFGATLAVMAPRLVAPCGRTPILQTSWEAAFQAHFGGVVITLRFLSGVVARETFLAGTAPLLVTLYGHLYVRPGTIFPRGALVSTSTLASPCPCPCLRAL